MAIGHGKETIQEISVARLGNTVTYSFRSPVLTNVTPDNADAIIALQQAKAITLYPATALAEIRPNSIVLDPLKSSGHQGEAHTALLRPIEIEK